MHELQTLTLYLLYHDAEYALLAHGVLGQEHESRAVLALLGDGYSLQQNELMRYLEHDARAVAGAPVSSLGSTVAHVLKHLEGVVHELMALVAVYVHYHAYAASVVLVGGIVQSFCLRLSL